MQLLQDMPEAQRLMRMKVCLAGASARHLGFYLDLKSRIFESSSGSFWGSKGWKLDMTFWSGWRDMPTPTLSCQPRLHSNAEAVSKLAQQQPDCDDAAVFFWFSFIFWGTLMIGLLIFQNKINHFVGLVFSIWSVHQWEACIARLWLELVAMREKLTRIYHEHR